MGTYVGYMLTWRWSFWVWIKGWPWSLTGRPQDDGEGENHRQHGLAMLTSLKNCWTTIGPRVIKYWFETATTSRRSGAGGTRSWDDAAVTWRSISPSGRQCSIAPQDKTIHNPYKSYNSFPLKLSNVEYHQSSLRPGFLQIFLAVFYSGSERGIHGLPGLVN